MDRDGHFLMGSGSPMARMVIGYTDVIDVGDTLLTGTLSQTWRFAAVCECHSITFYEVMI
jgi:hypothetical protein